MQPNSQERRTMRRFDMRLPAIVRLSGTNSAGANLDAPSLDAPNLGGTNLGGTNLGWPNDERANEFHTETQNVSARGVFFYLDRAVQAGTTLEVTLTFPPHVTLTDAVRVRFTARVIRIESALPSARIGTAAMIENYEFLRSTDTPDFLTTLQNEWKAAH